MNNYFLESVVLTGFDSSTGFLKLTFLNVKFPFSAKWLNIDKISSF